MLKNQSYVSDKPIIHPSVKIGPFCYIGDNVVIKKKCELKSHVSLIGNTIIGEEIIFDTNTDGIVTRVWRHSNFNPKIR